MSVKPYQVKMEPQAHDRLKKRAKQVGITIGEMIQNLLASFELRMKNAHKTLEDNERIDVSSLDSVEVDTALIKILLTKDYRDLTDKEFEEEQIRVLSSLRKDEWKPEIKFDDISDYEPFFTKEVSEK
jgi:type II secretory pathway component PulL